MSAISFKIKVGCFCPTIFLKLFYKTPRLFKAPLFLFTKRKDIHFEYPYLLNPNLSTNAVYLSRSLFFKYFNKSLLLPIFFKRPLFE